MADETSNPDGKAPDKGASPAESMVDRWARQSAGLPSELPAKADPSEKEEIRQFYRLGGMGLEIVGTVIIFTLVGYWLDRLLKWHYIATITLAVVSFVGGMYLFIKEAMRLNK